MTLAELELTIQDAERNLFEAAVRYETKWAEYLTVLLTLLTIQSMRDEFTLLTLPTSEAR